MTTLDIRTDAGVITVPRRRWTTAGGTVRMTDNLTRACAHITVTTSDEAPYPDAPRTITHVVRWSRMAPNKLRRWARTRTWVHMSGLEALHAGADLDAVKRDARMWSVDKGYTGRYWSLRGPHDRPVMMPLDTSIKASILKASEWIARDWAETTDIAATIHQIRNSAMDEPSPTLVSDKIDVTDIDWQSLMSDGTTALDHVIRDCGPNTTADDDAVSKFNNYI